MFCQLFMFFSVLSASETSTIEPELTCYTSDGENYRGTIAWTVSGKTCQNWSAQTPHKHYWRPEKNPHAGLDGNYCRNPDGGIMPWCYTISDTKWEYCPVPRCEDAPRPEPPVVSTEPPTEPPVVSTEPPVVSTEPPTEPPVVSTEPPIVCTEPKQVLQLKLILDDPTVDLNDPDVMAAILKQVKENLKQRGLSGDVKLTWTKHPGGKVLQKEETKGYMENSSI